MNSDHHLRLSGQDKRQAYSLCLIGLLKTQKSFPVICEKFNNVLIILYSSIQSLAFTFQKLTFYNAKGKELECKR